MTEAEARPSASSWVAWAPFLAVALICTVAAFIGLNASGYWIDELFTLYVADHHGGWAEVLRRALTDTHPPAYYLIAYEWIQLFGGSETSVRLLSGLFAVAALPVLFFGLRGTFSLPARSFAVALGAGSKLFFEQSQNARSYGLCLLLAALLLVIALALHRRFRAGGRFPAGLLAALWAVGLLGAFVHFYLFLAAGMVHLFLLLSARTYLARGFVVLSGAVIAALMALYVVSLLGHSQQDLQDMWFSNKLGELVRQALGGVMLSWSGLAIGGVLLLVLAPWVDRVRAAGGGAAPPTPAVPIAPLQLCGLVILGTVAAGLVVSFVIAPSFGRRNLMVLGPFFWVLAAWLYDAVGPDPRRRPSLILILLLIALTGSNAVITRSRLAPRSEDWRGSAAYVDALPACAGQPIPVVMPFVFGPSTPFFRELSRVYFFGRYARSPERLRPFVPVEFAPATADPQLAGLLRARVSQACPILAWGVHDLNKAVVADLHRDIAATAGLPASRVRVRTFDKQRVRLLGFTKSRPSAFVFERVD